LIGEHKKELDQEHEKKVLDTARKLWDDDIIRFVFGKGAENILQTK